MNDYNIFADILNKFHTSPMLIQGLWLVALCVIFCFLVGCIAQIVLRWIDRKYRAYDEDYAGKLLYTLHVGENNELLVMHHQSGDEDSALLRLLSTKKMDEEGF